LSLHLGVPFVIGAVLLLCGVVILLAEGLGKKRD
jgi:hypothetical protein